MTVLIQEKAVLHKITGRLGSHEIEIRDVQELILASALLGSRTTTKRSTVFIKDGAVEKTKSGSFLFGYASVREVKEWLTQTADHTQTSKDS